MSRERALEAWIAVAFFVLLALRSESKIREPAVWVEDGIYLQDIDTAGVSSLFTPTNSFLHIFSKAITYGVSRLTLVYYPIVSIVLSLVIATVVCLQVKRLFGGRWGTLAAFSVVLIPSDPEVFGLPSYIFWWSGVYLMALSIASAQKIEERSLAGLVIMVPLAALSGPFSASVLPIFLGRWVLRSKIDRWTSRLTGITGVLGASALIQMNIARTDDLGGNSRVPVESLLRWFYRLPGSYFAGIHWPERELLLTSVVLGMVVVVLVVRRHLAAQALGLIVLFLIVSTQSALRVIPEFLDPKVIGPRYFFMPYVLIGWIVTFALSRSSHWPTMAVLTGLTVLQVFNLYPVIDRSVVTQNWHTYVAGCEGLDGVSIPRVYDGSSTPMGYFNLSRSFCESTLLDRFITVKDSEVVHRFVPADDSSARLSVCESQIIDSFEFVPGSDVELKSFALKELVSNNGVAQDSSRFVRVRVNKGQTLFFRRDVGRRQVTLLLDVASRDLVVRPMADPNWYAMHFVHDDLPESFVVEVRDEARGPREWSAIALRSDC